MREKIWIWVLYTFFDFTKDLFPCFDINGVNKDVNKKQNGAVHRHTAACFSLELINIFTIW